MILEEFTAVVRSESFPTFDLTSAEWDTLLANEPDNFLQSAFNTTPVPGRNQIITST